MPWGAMIHRLCPPKRVATIKASARRRTAFPPLPLPAPCNKKKTHGRMKSDRIVHLFSQQIQRQMRSGLIHFRGTATWKEQDLAPVHKIGLTGSAHKEKKTGKGQQSMGRGVSEEFRISPVYCARKLAGHIGPTRGGSFPSRRMPVVSCRGHGQDSISRYACLYRDTP
ncbi:hypothetical protein BC826DRAFT_567179 [Russula brevipes]|nr:hypothetical protein BC826DRAFT_567179 [Russula brevipes]